MDDLIMFISYDKNSTISQKQAEDFKSKFLNQNVLYTGGLDLEEQGYVQVSTFTTLCKLQVF